MARDALLLVPCRPRFELLRRLIRAQARRYPSLLLSVSVVPSQVAWTDRKGAFRIPARSARAIHGAGRFAPRSMPPAL